MPNLLNSIKERLTQKEPLPTGLYTYQTPPEAEDQHRLHLRIEKDGTGLLVIDASTVLHLNQTATEFAFHLIKENDADQVAESMTKRYRMDKEHIRQDYEQFSERVQTMIDTPNMDPVTFLDIERQEPYTDVNSAPYRLDCALTYRVPDDSHLEHAPLDRVERELTTDEWNAVFHKAFNNGIPHLLFTGGEPTIREDLPDLILHAEEVGLVTGLVTDGLKLSEDAYRSKLLVNGLDHLLIIFDPDNQQEWAMLEKVLEDELFTTVHLTLIQGQDLHPTIDRLAAMGVRSLSLSESDRELTDELQHLRDYAAEHQLDLVWDMPVPYSKNNPVVLELEKGENQSPPKGAGKAWLYVEPDGDVLPAQGQYEKVLGNILTDPWEEIWEQS